MNRDEADRVEGRLRRLDATTTAALVADLWAARGFDTRRDGTVVAATRRGTTTRLRVVTGARVGSGTDGDPDVVVAPDGGRAGGRVAAAAGADLLAAGDLRRMLRHAVDPATAATLCERHLGAAPASLRPPLGDRVRRRVGDVSGAAMPEAVAVLVVVLLGGAVVVPDVGVGTAGGGPANASAAADGAGVDGAAGADVPSAATVPGLDGRRIADVSALAAAHDRGLEEQSYVLRYDYRGPPDWGVGRSPVHRRTEATVDGERFVLATRVTVDNATLGAKRVYHDGEGWYVADGPDDEFRYIPERGGAPSMEADPAELRRILVYRYLSTPNSTVVGPVVRDGTTLYRVVGRGRPAGMRHLDALNYTVRAHVDRNGVVRDLTARYALETDAGRTTVVVAVRHGRLGTATVTPPEGTAGEDDDGNGDGDERLT